MANKDLISAKRAKKDEFYTQLTDIEKELHYYKALFYGKTVLCNCDDPRVSMFYKYFHDSFTYLGLRRLITTCYKSREADLFSDYECEHGLLLDYEGIGKEAKITPLHGDGDFRSSECVELLKQADIVVTNPPFSLFRQYIAQLVEYDKLFLVIGNVNAVTYKEIFSLMKANKIWLGASIHSGDREFGIPDDYPITAAGYRISDDGKRYIRVKGVRWFTNLDYKERHEDIILYKHYTPEEYPRYDNYDAINVDKTSEIPCDYDGVMGVPITFIDKYNPNQFEILNANDYRTNDKVPFKEHGLIKDKDGTVNGIAKYARILIRKK